MRYIVLSVFISLLCACGGSSGNINNNPGPSNLTLYNVKPNSISIAWVYDGDLLLSSYEIFRDGVKINSVNGIYYTYTDKTVLPATHYCYTVRAKEYFLIYTKHSKEVCITTPADTISPTTPEWIIAGLSDESTAHIIWDFASDNGLVTGYQLYRNDVLINNDNIIASVDTNLQPDTTYCYHVVANDSVLNYSAPSDKSCITTSFNHKTINDYNTVSGYRERDKNIDFLLDSNGFSHISLFDMSDDSVKYITNSGGTWQEQFSEQFLDSYRINTTIRMDVNGKIHIIYEDPETRYLKYATNASGSWVITSIITPTDIVVYYNVDVDNTGKIHIIHSGGRDVVYTNNSTGTWVSEVLESNSFSSSTPAAIKIDAVNKVHIVYSNTAIKYVTNQDGSWVTTTIHASPATPNLFIDSNLNLHVCLSGDAGLVYQTNTGGNWSSNTVESHETDFCSITVEDNGYVHIAYQDKPSYGIYTQKYAVYDTTEWQLFNIAVGASPSFVYSSAPAYSTGWNSKIAIDNTGYIHIVYVESSAEGFTLKYADNIP